MAAACCLCARCLRFMPMLCCSLAIFSYGASLAFELRSVLSRESGTRRSPRRRHRRCTAASKTWQSWRVWSARGVWPPTTRHAVSRRPWPGSAPSGRAYRRGRSLAHVAHLALDSLVARRSGAPLCESPGSSQVSQELHSARTSFWVP